MPVSIMTSQGTSLPHLLPARHLLGAVEHRPGPDRTGGRDIRIPHAVQHRKRASLGKRPKPFGLFPGRHEEIPASRPGQSFDHRPRTQAIAVGLYRRAASRAATLPRQPAPVSDERIAVEAETECGR